jgi:hypothetical protein
MNKQTKKLGLATKGFSMLSKSKLRDLIFLSLITTFLSIIIACQKETPQSEMPITSYIEHKANAMFSNPSNNFDSVGYYHNIFVQQIRGIQNNNPNIENNILYDSLLLFQQNYYPHLPTQVEWSTAREDFLLKFRNENEQFYNNADTLISSWLERGFLTQNEFNYLNEALNLVDASHDQSLQDLLALEDDIISNNDLTSSERENLLIIFSTLRYSIDYWENNDQYWAMNNGNKSTFQFASCNRRCKWCVATADALGVIITPSPEPLARILFGAFASGYARCCGICSTCGNANCGVKFKGNIQNYRNYEYEL